jgi:hypothetical protein
MVVSVRTVGVLVAGLVVGVAMTMMMSMSVVWRMDMILAVMKGVLLGLGVSVMVLAAMAVVRRVGMIPPRLVGVTLRLGFVVVMPAMDMAVLLLPAAFMMSVVPVPAAGPVVGGQPHVHAQAVDAVSGILTDFQMKFLIQTKLGQFGPQEVGGYAQAEHGGQVHVAG